MTEREVEPRVIKLYAKWSAQISGAVPMRLSVLFDATQNDGIGGFVDVVGEITSTTYRPLRVSSLRASWAQGAEAGLAAIWPKTASAVLSTTCLTVTDKETGIEAAIDAAADDQQQVTTKNILSNEVLSTALSSKPNNVGAGGFTIPAATTEGAGVLKLSYGIRISPSLFVGPPISPKRAQGENSGLEMCSLTYTISLADPAPSA